MISNKDKINALVSLKSWLVQRHLYEIAVMIRDIEKKLLEETPDYIKVIKDIEMLSRDQKDYLLKILHYLKIHSKPHLRDLKITLI